VKITFEVGPEDYEKVATGEALILVDAVASVEIRQADGLLVLERRPLVVEGLSRLVAAHLGAAQGGPAIRVVLAQGGSTDG
jgi:hypothetical protein